MIRYKACSPVYCRVLLMFFILITLIPFPGISQNSQQYTNVITNQRKGSWSDSSIWSQKRVPGANDAVYLSANTVVEKNANCFLLNTNGYSIRIAPGVQFGVLGKLPPLKADSLALYDIVTSGNADTLQAISLINGIEYFFYGTKDPAGQIRMVRAQLRSAFAKDTVIDQYYDDSFRVKARYLTVNGNKDSSFFKYTFLDSFVVVTRFKVDWQKQTYVVREIMALKRLDILQDSMGAAQNDFTEKDLFDIVVGVTSGSVLETVLHASAGAAIGAGIGAALGVSGPVLAAGVATGGLIGTLEAAKASDLDDQRRTKPTNTSQTLKELFNKNPLLDDPSWYGQNAPFVLTTEVVQTGAGSVAVEAVILTVGSSPINAQGICWSKTPQAAPSVNDHVIHALPAIGGYQVSVGNLQPDSLYYFRAFAENNAGVAYGDVIGYKMPGAIDTLLVLTSHGTWSAYFLGDSESSSNRLGVTVYERTLAQCPDLVTSQYTTEKETLSFAADYSGTYGELENDQYWDILDPSSCTASNPVVKHDWFNLNFQWEYSPQSRTLKAKTLNDDGTTGDYVFAMVIKFISASELWGDYYGIEKGETYYSGFLKMK